MSENCNSSDVRIARIAKGSI